MRSEYDVSNLISSAKPHNVRDEAGSEVDEIRLSNLTIDFKSEIHCAFDNTLKLLNTNLVLKSPCIFTKQNWLFIWFRFLVPLSGSQFSR